MTSRPDIDEQLERAKGEGCIGVLVEIVANHQQGPVLDPQIFDTIGVLCAEKGLVFAADETLTAIRCGSPFAFQGPNYTGCRYQPDIVFFGKSLVARGFAANFHGPMLRRLNVDSTRQQDLMLEHWQRSFTQPIASSVLIESLGVLERIPAERWVERSSEVGRSVRKWITARAVELGLVSSADEVQLGGAGALIFIPKDICASLLVMPAAPVDPEVPYVRLMPGLGRNLASVESIDETIGLKSRMERRHIANQLMEEGSTPQWCFACGYRASGMGEWCRSCCVAACNLDLCIRLLGEHCCL